MPEKCEHHSSHSTTLEFHEKRLDAHDIEFKDVKDSMKMKISRWIFIASLSLVFSALFFQIKTLNEVSAKVAVLYDRQIMKDKNGKNIKRKKAVANFNIKPSTSQPKIQLVQKLE